MMMTDPAVLEAGASLLWRATLLLGLAVLLVLGIRPLLLRRFGASPAYAAWLLPPALLLALAASTLLPHPSLIPPLPVVLSAYAPSMAAALLAVPAPRASTGLSLILAAWLSGCLGFLVLSVMQQWRYVRHLRRAPGQAHWVSPAGSSPALLGVWRPRLVLPFDFEQRFSTAEQALVTAHEQVHSRRGDNGWNLLATALLGLQWFNPLAWLALRRMRGDQELACDAAVLRAHPEAASTYARALLKAQASSGWGLRAGIWSSWQSTHPLVERVAMLKLHATTTLRLKTGHRLLIGLGLLGAGAVYALQPGSADAHSPEDQGQVMLELSLQIDGKAGPSPKLRTALGQPASVILKTGDGLASSGGGEGHWSIEINTTRLSGGRLLLQSVLSHGEPLAPLSRPRLIVQEGEPARIEIGTPDGRHMLNMGIVARLASTADLPK